MKTMSQHDNAPQPPLTLRGGAEQERSGGVTWKEILLGILLSLVGWGCYIGAYAAFTAFCAGGD